MNLMKLIAKTSKHWWVSLLILFVANFAYAQGTSPEAQLKQTANRMISELKQNQGKLQDFSVIFNIVERVLVPQVDLDRMAGSVVGRQYWTTATSQQKQIFIKEFKKLVTNTYASALASYDDDKVQFYPGKGSTNVVRSAIVRKNGQQIFINYNVTRINNVWKVYDFSIDNISMVQSYRAQFANVLSSGGMNALITRLQAHNKAGS